MKYYVVCTVLYGLQVIVILGPALFGPLNEMEKVFVRQAEPISLRPRRDIGLIPNQVVAKDPAERLHGDGKARRNQEQLLLLSEISHWCASPVSGLFTEPLASARPDARPSREVGIAEVDPQTPLWLQAVTAPVYNLGEVNNVPFWQWLHAEGAAMASIPIVRRNVALTPSRIQPLAQNLPIVIQPISAMSPIGWARQQKVHAIMQKARHEIVCVARLHFGRQLWSDRQSKILHPSFKPSRA